MVTMLVKDLEQYPYLVDLLINLKTLPKRRPYVYKKLQEYSDLYANKAKQALEFGTLPLVSVEPGSFTWGNYDWSHTGRKNPRHTIALNNDFVHDFEVIGRWHKKALSDHYVPNEAWEEAIADANLKVEAIVLHELVHWGDWTFDSVTKDRQTREGEAGWAFLNEAYKPRKLRNELTAESIRARVERWNR